MSLLKQSLTLANGIQIPVIGLGTWQMSPKEAEKSVAYALKNGYTHIDTARTYGNEEGVGKGIKESGLERSDYFITTKISAFSKTFKDAKQDIHQSLSALDLDYIDLVIIHAPRPWDVMYTDKFIENKYYYENTEVWHALEEAYEDGLIKSLGVSNFAINDLENLLGSTIIKPMLNQIKYHIGYRDEALVQFCQEHNMVVEAYSPMGTGKLLTHPKIIKIAEKYNKTAAQISIRYAYQKGLVVLPKSVHPEYIDQNGSIEFVIGQDDMDDLNRLVIR